MDNQNHGRPLERNQFPKTNGGSWNRSDTSNNRNGSWCKVRNFPFYGQRRDTYHIILASEPRTAQFNNSGFRKADYKQDLNFTS